MSASESCTAKPCFFNTTIGMKLCVAVSAIIITGFVLSHMLGNLLMFVGPEAYNNYGHGITSSPLYPVIEMVLLASFLGHIIFTILLTRKNRKARPVGYAVQPNGPKGTSPVAKSLIIQGLLILAFVILHLITFRFGTYYPTTVDGKTVRDLYKLMEEVFKSPIYVGWYVVCMIVLGLHLKHGVSSIFQSLGFNHPKYNKLIKVVGICYAWIVAIGFLSQPIYIFLK